MRVPAAGRALRRLAPTLLATCVLAGGCGGDDPPPAAEGPRTVLLRVGVLPVANTAPLYLGIERGYFREAGLNMRPQTTAGGASVVAGVASGDLQFGLANPVSLVSAAANDAPVQIVAQGTLGGRTARDAWANLLVLESGPIREIAELAGKRIAVNLRNDISELAVRHLLEPAGVEPDEVEFVPVPFPQMTAALEAGRVDAIAAVEPFVSQARALGVRDLAPFYVRLLPDLPVALYFTSAQYAIDHPDVVERFMTAMRRSLEYARDHPEEVRRIVPTFTTISPAVAQRMKLPVFDTRIDPAAIESVAALMERYGLIERRPRVADMLAAET